MSDTDNGEKYVVVDRLAHVVDVEPYDMPGLEPYDTGDMKDILYVLDKSAKDMSSRITELEIAHTEYMTKLIRAVMWLIITISIVLLALLFLVDSAAASEINEARLPKTGVLVQPFTSTVLPTVSVLDVDGYGTGCTQEENWVGGHSGSYFVTLSPTDTDTVASIDFRYIPYMDYPRFDLVDPDTSLSREQWKAVTLVADDIWRYVAQGTYPDSELLEGDWQHVVDGLEAVETVNNYLFQESCMWRPRR